jgi:hypothetical protein
MIDEVMRIRIQMAAEGWRSPDAITRDGWGGNASGYHITFSRVDWHGKTVDDLLASYHGDTRDLTKIHEAAQQAAGRARRALHEFPDRPPVQSQNGELISRPVRPGATIHCLRRRRPTT